ncbi:MAG: CcdB family protein [Alphaproteobacteria bacterium]|nr:CcdB family protein [Alphaproteobacteria bacterium]
MAQFDVYPNPTGGMSGAAPYVLDVQSDHVAHLPTRMVVPLARPDEFQPLRHLNPLVEVKGERMAALVQFMAAVPREVLRDPVASLKDRRQDFVNAIDFLFTGI